MCDTHMSLLRDKTFQSFTARQSPPMLENFIDSTKLIAASQDRLLHSSWYYILKTF